MNITEPNGENKTNISSKIAIQISAQHAFNESSGISWITTVPQDIDQDQLDNIFSKMRVAIYRQHKWLTITRLETELEMTEKQNAQLLTSINIIDEQYPVVDHRPTDKKTARQQAVDSITRNQDLLKTYRDQIIRTKSELNGSLCL